MRGHAGWLMCFCICVCVLEIVRKRVCCSLPTDVRYESLPLRLSKLPHLYCVCSFSCLKDNESSPVFFDNFRYVQSYVKSWCRCSFILIDGCWDCGFIASGHKRTAIMSDSLPDLTLINRRVNSGARSGQKLVDVHSRHQLWLKHNPLGP